MFIKTTIAAALLCLCQSMLFAQEAAPATVTQQAPTDMTVYGMRLGEKFAVPECKRAPKNDLLKRTYDVYTDVPARCFERPDADTVQPNVPIVTAEVGILLPEFKDHPEFIATNAMAWELNRHAPILAQIIDGKLEGITIYTMGLEFQDALLTTLKEKYGEPTHIEEEKKGNAFGAVFSSHKATWDKGTGLSVIFYGTLDRTDIGSINIWTDKCVDYLAKHPTPQVGPKL